MNEFDRGWQFFGFISPSLEAENWRLVFEHDDGLPLGTLVETDGRLQARPVEPEV